MSLNRCEMFFTLPAFGHTWILEKSTDGKQWQVCDIQNEKAVRSPHVATGIGDARYLKVKIVTGNPGLWEIKVY